MRGDMPTPPPAHQPHMPSQIINYPQLLQAPYPHPAFMHSPAYVAADAYPRMTYSPGAHHAVMESESRERERDRERREELQQQQQQQQRLAPSLPAHLRLLTGGGEHRATESPMQASVAHVAFSSAGYHHHRPPSGHLLAPHSPSSLHRQTHMTPSAAYSAAEEAANAGYRPSPPPAHGHGGILRSSSVTAVAGEPALVVQQQQQQVMQVPTASSSPLLSRPLAMRSPPPPQQQHVAPQVPPQDSLVMLLQRYPIMWQGLLALKNDHAVVQMHFISGNPHVARGSLPCGADGIPLPLRIAQRMRLEQQQLEGVHRKIQMEAEHCILLALPCGRDPMDITQQLSNLQHGFITYLQSKQAAGIVNIAAPGSQQVKRQNTSFEFYF